MEKVNLAAKFRLIDDAWHPRTVAELNGQVVRLAILEGPFVWHHHEAEDEMFLVVKGDLTIEVRDGSGEREVALAAGEFLVVPRGVEHRPVAHGRVQVVLFEPATTVNTGNVRNARTVEESLPL